MKVTEQRSYTPTLGVIIPCFNEEDVFPMLVRELQEFADSLEYEVNFLIVDDGSSDRTWQMASDVSHNDLRFGCIRLSRNFGHQTAVSAGLQHIKGDVVAVIDADLQDPPHVIKDMIDKWYEGYDVVYGVRVNRKEGILLRSAYSIFYRMMRKVANIDVPLDAGDFSLMDRRVVDHINAMPEHNRFVRGLRGWVGFNQVGVEYERSARAAGEPKYNLKKLFKLAMDGIITFSSMPLRLAVWIGTFSALLGFLYLFYVVILALFYQETPSGWASLVVLFLFIGGIQLLILGIIGEYIGRIFEEVKNRPVFVISDKAGWAEETEPLAEKSVNY